MVSDPLLTHTLSWTKSSFYNFVLQADPSPETDTYTGLPLATPRTLQLPVSSVSSPKPAHTPLGFPISQQPCQHPLPPHDKADTPVSPPSPPTISPPLGPSCPLTHNVPASLSPQPQPQFRPHSLPWVLTLSLPCSQPSPPCGSPVLQLQVQALSGLVSPMPVALSSLLQEVFVAPTKPSWWPKHPLLCAPLYPKCLFTHALALLPTMLGRPFPFPTQGTLLIPQEPALMVPPPGRLP